MRRKSYKGDWYLTAPPDASWENPNKSHPVSRKGKVSAEMLVIGWKCGKGKELRLSARIQFGWPGNTCEGRLTGGAGILSNQHTTEYRQVVIRQREQWDANADW